MRRSCPTRSSGRRDRAGSAHGVPQRELAAGTGAQVGLPARRPVFRSKPTNLGLQGTGYTLCPPVGRSALGAHDAVSGLVVGDPPRRAERAGSEARARHPPPPHLTPEGRATSSGDLVLLAGRARGRVLGRPAPGGHGRHRWVHGHGAPEQGTQAAPAKISPGRHSLVQRSERSGEAVPGGQASQ